VHQARLKQLRTQFD
jgi:signal transduction histidine kinase